MEEKKILKMVEELAGATVDTPFESDRDILIFRHGKNGKWFGALLNAPRRAVDLAGGGTARVLNVKCDPMLAEILKQNFADIVSAYHMNKLHWISLRVEGDLPEEEWEKLIRLSYTLTLPKCRRAKS